MKRLLITLCVVLTSLTLPLARSAPKNTVASAAPVEDTYLYLPLVAVGRTNTALDYVPPYTGQFHYGLNPGYYGNGWSDTGIYQLCYDAGCRTARNTLPDHFIAEWGVDIRRATFDHIVNNLGFGEITTFLEGPRDDWRDPTLYDGQQSELWQGLYEPIWDNGENDTPVNDNNRFALYVWLIVSHYGDAITFYEIINEPDYTATSHGWEAPGTAGNWWENPPQPGDLRNLHAPVYHYIRTLRIAYAVVKRYDPSAYVTPGGLGYASFLDALLRYSDNPDGGKITTEYPLTGGAYFDALSLHAYPQYGTRHWDGSQWVPDRHSDKAVEVFLDSKAEKEAVLIAHGYDGITYPRKPIIFTELNVARKQIGETLGGIELQRNFTVKALVKAQQSGIGQIYWFVTGENKNYDDPTASSYDLMGFYENLKRDAPGSQKLTQQGIANRTTFEQLFTWQYDEAATLALNLPATADGVAFSKGGNVRYVLWARTTQDRSESAEAAISLPGNYTQITWDGNSGTVSGANLTLTGTPVFLIPQ